MYNKYTVIPYNGVILLISIALCDDEVKYLDIYETKINKIAKKLNIDYEVIRFSNGESLLFYLADNPNKFHIIYLDIITGGINGIETAMEIRKFNQFAKIIFLTSSPSFVYSAFDANATNYLLKNTHDNKFEDIFIQTINKLQLSLNQDVIRFKSNKEDIIFNLNNIIYIESFKRLVIIHLNNDVKHEFYYKLSDLTNELSNKGFILTHRSYLVNLQYIKKITNTDVVLKNEVSVPVSRNLLPNVRNAYISYLNKK